MISHGNPVFIPGRDIRAANGLARPAWITGIKEADDDDSAEPQAPRSHVRRRSLERGHAKDHRVLREQGQGPAARGLLRRVWYADFLEFVRAKRIFATMCTPAGEGAADARWDTWRICEFAEILGFYGLQYWYTWQVSVLGLGPIWMSANARAAPARAARALEDGGIFAFGLSERSPRRRHLLDRHGADAARRRLARQRAQVLHRQRQRGGHRLDLRPHRRERRVRILRREPAATRTTT